MKKNSLIITLSVVIGLSAIGGGYLLAKSNNKNDDSKPVTTGPTEDGLEYANTNASESETDSISAYTGELLNSEQVSNPAFMCIIENSRQARPQSGLSQADIVYETMAEGGISRFVALYNSKTASKIGPIRSARYAFLDLIEEYDLPFAHCGGSYDALDRISTDTSLKSLNEMANGSSFSRDNARVAPHNLYTSSEQLESLISAKEFSTETTREFTFDDEYWANPELDDCQNIDLKLSFYYTTGYNFTENGYVKSMDNTETIDAYNNEPLSFDNIVIQLTDINNRTENEYMDINLVGSGDAYVISNGKMVKGTWNKSSTDDTTILKDSSGNEIPFSPGNTIWHIADSTNELTFN